MRLKQKLKSYFKTRDSSDSAVEFLRMWLQPFIDLWSEVHPDSTIDNAISAFFGEKDRRIYDAVAKADFRMPGGIMKCGNRYTIRVSNRQVRKGQNLILAVDKKDQEARVDVVIDGKYLTFKLTRAEMEYLKDRLVILTVEGRR